MHKSSYTISWIHYNLYQIYNISLFLIRHNLADSGTLYMKIDLFKITKYFAHYICLHTICMSNNFLKAPCAQILKFKMKNPIYSVKFWQIHKYNVNNDYLLKFIFCTRMELNLLFRFELSSLVTLSKHWFLRTKQWPHFDGQNLKTISCQKIFCNHFLHYIEQDLLCLRVEIESFQLFSLRRRISDFISWSFTTETKINW